MKKLALLIVFLLFVLTSDLIVQAQQADSMTYMPIIQQSGAVIAQQEPTPAPQALTIRGTVLSTDEQMTSAAVELWTYHPSITGSTRYVGEFIWESSGAQAFEYQFNEIPRLTLGYRYYVVYNNRARDEDFLEKWYSAGVRNPLAGNILEMAPIDAAHIELDSPKDGQTKSLPYTFEWDERGTESDQYIVQFYQEDTAGNITLSAITDRLPHPTESVTITSIYKPGFRVGVEYRWRILVFDGTGALGIPLESRRITFESLSGVAASSLSRKNAATVGGWQDFNERSINSPSWQDAIGPYEFAQVAIR